ncbi:hypothetical protein CEUSTIGMA_g11512.t1 [Chlamydomonas eustigma]|uniref:Uncharacterized protein n=1 Tax=Chlamydomonas eustigma TaxID=1157962 RepID=A0A250XLY8_9CHLO|nr:hypothetical protein CEUSTIGMA_g11512.t1 [Chlamydomonas eustigma]|eukprot:GAX84088.1 hypothetical protein CEUSTIGMA_g11512.t1 [Chlamydomonas eustigma]
MPLVVELLKSRVHAVAGGVLDPPQSKKENIDRERESALLDLLPTKDLQKPRRKALTRPVLTGQSIRTKLNGLLSNKNGANNPRYIALLEMKLVKLKKEPREHMAALVAAKRLLKMAADCPLTYPSLFPLEGSVVTFPSGVVHRWDDRAVTVQGKDVAAFVKMKNPKNYI